MTQDKKKSTYSATWDRYVSEVFDKIKSGPKRTAEELLPWQVLNTTDDEYVWPGDEWGDSTSVQHIMETCVFSYLDENPNTFCEIASGAGRMTSIALERYPHANIDCFDISREFLDQVEKRFANEMSRNRLRTFLLTEDPRFMYRTLDQASLTRKIDCIFSFDAMVHVELHSVLIYIATAAAVLKPKGLLSMSVADATNEHGFHKLLNNAPSVFKLGGDAGMHFQFASPDIIRTLLDPLGFSYDFHDCNGRDLFFSARLDNPDIAQAQFEKAGSSWWL